MSGWQPYKYEEVIKFGRVEVPLTDYDEYNHVLFAHTTDFKRFGCRSLVVSYRHMITMWARSLGALGFADWIRNTSPHVNSDIHATAFARVRPMLVCGANEAMDDLLKHMGLSRQGSALPALEKFVMSQLNANFSFELSPGECALLHELLKPSLVFFERINQGGKVPASIAQRLCPGFAAFHVELSIEMFRSMVSLFDFARAKNKPVQFACYHRKSDHVQREYDKPCFNHFVEIDDATGEKKYHPPMSETSLMRMLAMPKPKPPPPYISCTLSNELAPAPATFDEECIADDVLLQIPIR